MKFFKDKFFPGGGPFYLFGPPQPVVEHEGTSPEELEASTELQEDASEPLRDAACPPQEQRRLRQRQLRDGVGKAKDQDQPLEPLPRRSARITGMKRLAEPLPSQAAPNKKRPRGRAAPPKAAAPTAAAPSAQPKTRPVPARAPPKGKTETRPRQGRGRPRKENGPSMRSAVGKKPARTPAPAGTGNGRAAGKDALGVPKRGGRLRKKE